ncbi:MAG TPA: thioredoxin-like domain-containing protein [Lentimicrobium sp.]|nr:thioredoxin-like domain-containing protein [Lentimicrobium sp.]
MKFRSFLPGTLLLITILFSQVQTVWAQSFRITIKLEGLNDSLLLLASYAGDKQFVVDTAFPDKQFNYRFQGDSLLPEGMYIIAGASKNKLFDFIVADKQIITITGDKDNLPSSLKSKADDQNKLLFEYVTFLSSKHKEMSQLQALKKRFPAGSDSAKIVDNRINLLNDEVDRHIEGLINTHQGKFFSVFLKSMQEPKVPAPVILPNGRPDSVSAFNNYKNHFWDNIDLSDSRVIRTPVIHSKVEQYLNKLTLPAPDSLISSIDKLISMTGSNFDSFKYLIWYLIVKYESSEIMGHDAVFVHIIDKYFSDQRMTWMNASVRENLIKRAKTLEPILISKTAPPLILMDTLGIPVSLHSIKNKYTIIYFWDPECSHCKKETPLLTSFYNDFSKKFDFEVYAVCMDTSWTKMKEYILKNKMNWVNVNGYYSMSGDFRELYDVHSSPVMYLLDDQKKIIAKRILTDQIKMIIQKREEGL